ncbi:MAG: hypothetical protein H8K03_14460 [Nitrospira sp.]
MTVPSFVPFPYVCSEDITHYKFALQCYTAALINFEPVRIECGNTVQFRPLGLTLLAAMIHDLHLRGKDILFTPPAKAETLQYLTDQGFFEEFDFRGPRQLLRRRANSKSVMLRRLDQFEGSYPMQIANWLVGNSNIPRYAIVEMVTVTLPEIIYNVFDHSKSLIGCCVCAQAYQSTKQLMISVTDFGIGFLETLTRLYPQLNSEASAVALAIQPGVTSRARQNNAGAGLHILSEWLRIHHGDLEIISKDGVWKQFSDGKTMQMTLPFSFPGSSINLCIHTDLLQPTFHNQEEDRYA